MFFRKTKSLPFSSDNLDRLPKVPKNLNNATHDNADDDEDDEMKRCSIDSLVLRRLQGDAMAKWKDNSAPLTIEDNSSNHSSSTAESPSGRRRVRRNLSDTRRIQQHLRGSRGNANANDTPSTPSGRSRRMRRIQSADDSSPEHRRTVCNERRHRRHQQQQSRDLPARKPERRSLSPRPEPTSRSSSRRTVKNVATDGSGSSNGHYSSERRAMSSTPPRRHKVMSHAA